MFTTLPSWVQRLRNRSCPGMIRRRRRSIAMKTLRVHPLLLRRLEAFRARGRRIGRSAMRRRPGLGFNGRRRRLQIEATVAEPIIAQFGPEAPRRRKISKIQSPDLSTSLTLMPRKRQRDPHNLAHRPTVDVPSFYALGRPPNALVFPQPVWTVIRMMKTKSAPLVRPVINALCLGPPHWAQSPLASLACILSSGTSLVRR